MTRHIESVDPRIRPRLREYREDHRRVTIAMLRPRAKNEGDVLRQDVRRKSEASQQRGGLRAGARQVNMAEAAREVNLTQVHGGPGETKPSLDSDLTSDFPPAHPPRARTRPPLRRRFGPSRQV